MPCDITDLQIDFGSFTLIWNLSSSRFISFKFKDVKTIKSHFVEDGKKYMSSESRIKINLISSEAQLTHYKLLNDHRDEFYRCSFVPIENNMITGNGQGLSNADRNPQAEKVSEVIIDAKQFQIWLDFDMD